MKTVCALALMCVAMSAPAGAGVAPAGTATYVGYISDHRCGANIDAACNKQCFQQGETPVLVVDGTGDVLDITNADTVTNLPGAHVQIAGRLDAKKLTVVDVKRLN